MSVGGIASAASCSISPTRITHPSRVARPISQTRLLLQNRRLPVQRSVVKIFGRRRDHHYGIELCGMLYHQFVDPRPRSTFEL